MIRKCYKFYTLIMTLMWVMAAMTASAFAVDDMWTVANRIIVDVYPDVVSVKQMCIMLGGISMKTAYKLLGNGEIHHLKIGKSFKIPKICVIEYLLG